MSSSTSTESKKYFAVGSTLTAEAKCCINFTESKKKKSVKSAS